MQYGLSDKTIESIQKVFESNSKIDEVILFGSRAKGNYREGSDIDLAVKGRNISFDDILKLNGQLDDLNLPYKFDLLDYAAIKEKDLTEHIDRVGIVFYKRWKEFKFSDFVEINPVIKFDSKESVSFIEMNDLHDGERFCFPNAERRLSGGAKFKEYDTLFARITPCLENGKICQAKGLKDGVGFGSTEFLVFRGKKNISDNDFVFYLSRWDEVREFAESNFEGTSGRQRVPKDCFDNLLLNVPPYSEQISIASILTSLDDKIDLLHRQNKTLEALAETIFRQWFVEGAKKEWEEKSLDEIADYLNGLACQKFPPQSEIEKLPVIKIKEMKNGFSENVDWATSDVPQEYIIETGDILFSWSGSLDVMIWAQGKGVLNQHLFKVTSEKYPKWFYYLATKFHLDEFTVIAESKTTTMGHIQRKHLSEAKMKVPSANELQEIDKVMNPLIEKIISNYKQIKTLTQLRDTLLPKLMSGEVRVEM